MVGTDGSHYANNAAERAAELQKNWKSEIVIFHSTNHHKLHPSLYPDKEFPQEIYNNIEDLSKEAGKEILKNIEGIFDKSISPVKTRLIEKEDPEDYISRVVEEEGFDLVVIGSRGHHSKIKELLLGTVSTNVSKSCPCDVLIVR
ncbi:MAG: universal stress protein [Promethearchaeota archaeon]